MQHIPDALAGLLGDAYVDGHVRGIHADGTWCEGHGSMLEVHAPSTGEVIVFLSAADTTSVDTAIDAAHRAFPAWRATAPGERAARLDAIARIVEAQREPLIALQCLCNGKPRHEASLDVDDVIACFDYYANLCRSGKGLEAEPVEVPADGYHAKVQFEPCGVAALIVPWNFPMVTTAWKLAPALAAGCTVVLKPSELTPLAEVALAELIRRSGLPRGVMNVLCGDGTTGAALAASPRIAKISFTGSTAVGRTIMRTASDRLQRVSLELGGKSALIVCADADVERAVDLAIGGAFFNAGQMCSATSRILIAQPIYDLFARRFVERAVALRLDDQGDEKAELGPLISETQRNRVMSHVEAGRREARVLLDAKVPERDGYFMTPAVFGDVPLDAPIWREEIFGPVACLRSFSEDDEAISLANDSEYGLVATVVTRDARRADAFARDLQVGMVWVNAPQIIFPQTGWGGFRQSGLGRELGPWGLRAYQEIRHVVTMA